MPKLSKRTVDAIRPDAAGRDAFVWDSGDGALKGFGVRMKPSGAATYLCSTGPEKVGRVASQSAKWAC
jgi:hypothetical protein